MTYRIGLKFCKFTSENFVKIFFLVVWVNYCWSHHFLTKVILVKLKILFILMQLSKYCKIIISFLELFSATGFLWILKTQLAFCMQVMMNNYSLLYALRLWNSRGQQKYKKNKVTDWVSKIYITLLFSNIE